MEDILKLIESKDELIKEIDKKIEKENNPKELDLILKEKHKILNEKQQLTNILIKLSENNISNQSLTTKIKKKKKIL